MNLNLNLHLVESAFLEKSTKKQHLRENSLHFCKFGYKKVVKSIVQGFQAMINEIG